jgi:adenylate cyclase
MGNLFAELKRRHIYRVAAAYAVVAWVLIQLVNNITPMLKLPDLVGTIVLVLLAVGFPVAILFAWIHQLAPVDSGAARATTNKLDWVLIGGLATVLAVVSYQQLAPTTGARTAQQASVTPTSTLSQPSGISVAVLPFVNLSSDKEQEFFSDGMTEEITAALAKIPSLQVVARTSAFEFKGQNRSIQAIGQALHARYVIEGSVRKAGDQVRITAQLIQAENGLHVWTDSYDRQLTNVFAIQEDIAQAIAGALRVPLGLKQGETLVSNRTGDTDSYEEYLRARTLYRARSLDEAIKTLEPVVTREPRYAPAWALLARAYNLVPVYGPTLRTTTIEQAGIAIQASQAKAEMAAQKAISLDSRYAGGYSALADMNTLRGHWKQAEDLFRQALAIDAIDPDTLTRYGVLLISTGRLKQGLAVAERLLVLEPFVPVYNWNAAVALQLNGRNDSSIPILEAISPSTAGSTQRNAYLARAYAANGRFAEAADTILAIRGNQVTRESVENAARLLRAAPAILSAPRSLPVLEGELSFVYAHVGALDRALDYPERGVAIKFLGLNTFSQLWYPTYTPLRKTERFKALARNTGLVDYWRARGWPDLCRPVGVDDFECD